MLNTWLYDMVNTFSENDINYKHNNYRASGVLSICTLSYCLNKANKITILSSWLLLGEWQFQYRLNQVRWGEIDHPIIIHKQVQLLSSLWRLLWSWTAMSNYLRLFNVHELHLLFWDEQPLTLYNFFYWSTLTTLSSQFHLPSS